MSDVEQTDTLRVQEPGDVLFALSVATSDALHVKDADGHYVFANEACARLIGCPVHEIIGRTDAMLLPAEAAGAITLRDRMVRESGLQMTFVEYVDLPGLGRRVFHTIKGPLLTEHGMRCTFGISRDITDVGEPADRHANQLLREHELHYRTLVSALSDGVFVAQDRRFVFGNPSLERALGYAPGEFVDVPFDRVVSPQHLALFTERFDRRIIGTNPPGVYEVALAHKTTGEPAWFELNANLVEFCGMPAVLGILRDVRERWRVQQAIIEQGELEQRLAHLMATAPGVVHAIHLERDGRMRFLFASAGIEAIYGLSADALCRDASMLPGMTHPQDFQRIGAAMRAAQEGLLPFHEEFRVLHPSRGEVWVEIHSLPHRGFDGAVTFTGHISDITARKRREIAERQDTQEMLDLANDSIVVTGPDGIAYWNRSSERMFGYTADEVLGRPFNQFLVGVTPETRDEVERCLRERGHWDGEGTVRRKDGTNVVAWFRLTAKLDPQGGLARVLAICQDMTAQRAAEQRIGQLDEQLKQHARALVERNRELETFTYSVSHDLKAPLRGIDGYSRLLLDEHAGQLDDEGRRFLDNVRLAAKRMGALIDDLLAYSRVERLDISPVEVRLDELVQSLIEERGVEIRERGVVVHQSLDVVRVTSEPEAVGLVLRNLIDNALKFTKTIAKPRLTVRSYLGGDRVCIEVEDNGIGFEMKYHDRIFEIFQRLHRSDDYPGTGIGLAIVRKSVDRLGGRVWARSSPGHGAIFHVELPGAA